MHAVFSPMDTPGDHVVGPSPFLLFLLLPFPESLVTSLFPKLCVIPILFWDHTFRRAFTTQMVFSLFSESARANSLSRPFSWSCAVSATSSPPLPPVGYKFDEVPLECLSREAFSPGRAKCLSPPLPLSVDYKRRLFFSGLSTDSVVPYSGAVRAIISFAEWSRVRAELPFFQVPAPMRGGVRPTL